MRKHDNFKIYCYKYAPESFKAWYNGKPLKLDNTSELGYIYITKGSKACIDELKRIIRKEQKTIKNHCYIGFYEKDTTDYYYTRQLKADRNNIHDMLYNYKAWKQHILDNKCKLEHVKITTGTVTPYGCTKGQEIDNMIDIDITRPCILKIKYV